MKKIIRNNKLLLSVFLISFFNLTCFDMYNEILENSDAKYRILIIETSNIANNRILQPDGSGTPAMKWINPSGPVSCHGSRIADFNNDGNPDIFFINNSINSQILYCDGSSNFGIPSLFTASSSFVDGEAADFNFDGYKDIFLVTNTGNIILFLNNMGDLNTGGSSTYSGMSNSNITTVSAADFNGDGKPDIVTGANGGDVEFVYWENAYDITADFNMHQYDISGGIRQISDSAVADFDNDGDMDVLLVSNSTGVFLMKNDGSGNFTEVPYLSCPSSYKTVSVGDLNGDGYTDAYVTSDINGDSNLILINKGNGSFTIKNHADTASLICYAGALGDIDMDGDLDVVVSAESATLIYLNNGYGELSMSGSYPAITSTTSVSLGALFK